jgi:hypothetical protein
MEGWKRLELVTPIKAMELGIKSDDPGFVSLHTSVKIPCEICGVLYGPLQYNVNHEVLPHHFHPGSSGGIYHYHHDISQYGLVTALLDCLNCYPVDSEGVIFHSEKIYVTKIMLYCENCGISNSELWRFTYDNDGYLTPYCHDCFPWPLRKVHYVATLRNKEIRFSEEG